MRSVYRIQKVSTPYWNTEQRAVAPGTQVGLTCNMFGATLVYQINDQGWIQTGTSSTLLTIDQPCTVPRCRRVYGVRGHTSVQSGGAVASHRESSDCHVTKTISRS